MQAANHFDYRPDFLARELSASLFEVLVNDLDWRQQEILLFGRKVMQPRLIDWMADEGVHYSYSGLSLQPGSWHPKVGLLRQRLSEELGQSLNSVLLNYYRDGQDAMGWHSDDEPELGPEPVIASISLGGTRRLLIRPKGGGKSWKLDLESGSLLVMKGRSQDLFQHSIPRTRQPVGPRINLTFRTIR